MAGPAAKGTHQSGMRDLGSLGDVTPAPLRCRWCGAEVTLLGDSGVPQEFRRAVHAATGLEAGDGGHVAAPIGQRLLAWSDC